MARKLTVANRLSRLHARGYSDTQIAVALGRGERGKSFIQKARTGRKRGDILAPAVKRLDDLTRRRTTGSGRPLPPVTAPRRAQAVRGRERIDTGDQRIYIGTSRTSGKFHAWKTLRARIERAAKRGERIRLTTNWRTGQWMGKRGGREHDGQQYTLWDEGMMAVDALEELDRYGASASPESAEDALAALIAEYTTTSDTYLRVEGFSSYSLQIYEPVGGWDVDDESEWA